MAEAPFENDLGPSDNPNIEQTIHVVPYNGYNWSVYIPQHAHVFSKSAEPSDVPHGARFAHSDYDYLLTPVQLNYALYTEAAKRWTSGGYTVEQAAADWTYRGVNVSPPPIGRHEPNENQQWIIDRVVRYRMDGKVDNHWGNVVGTEHCFFVVKYVKLDQAFKALTFTTTHAAHLSHMAADGKTVMTHVPQVVAIRADECQLHPDQLMYDFDVVDKNKKKVNVFGVGVPFYVGPCVVNRLYTHTSAESEEFTKKGSHIVAPARHHIDVVVRTC